MTERLHFHFSLSCIGERNGNPLQFLAWGIPGMGEPGGLPSVGSHRVGHDGSDLAVVSHDAKLNAVGKINAMYFKCDDWKIFWSPVVSKAVINLNNSHCKMEHMKI